MATRLGAAEEFAPFTMRITWWTAAAMQRQGLPPESGTAVQLLEYRSIDSWKLTVVSSSWDPAVVGTFIEVDEGTHFTFVAQARRLVSRVIPMEEGPEVPSRWLIPGLIDQMAQQGFVQMAHSSPEVVAFIGTDARTIVDAAGEIRVLDGTRVLFDRASRLPLSVTIHRDGALRESFEFEVVSRP